MLSTALALAATLSQPIDLSYHGFGYRQDDQYVSVQPTRSFENGFDVLMQQHVQFKHHALRYRWKFQEEGTTTGEVAVSGRRIQFNVTFH